MATEKKITGRFLFAAGAPPTDPKINREIQGERHVVGPGKGARSQRSKGYNHETG